MTGRPHPLPPVPEGTAAAVKAAFPKGNLYVALHTELGAIYDAHFFADFYTDRGHPVEVAPWRLALATIMQYTEGLTDRQTADAVRRCMDWKYALSLELTDPGFDFTLLHDFRQRLLAHDGAQCLLDTLLDTCKAHGWIRTRGTQRPCIGIPIALFGHRGAAQRCVLPLSSRSRGNILLVYYTNEQYI
jgi:transposase